MSSILLLDVMDTLVTEPFRGLPKLLGMTMEELLAAKDPDAWIEFEHGRIDEAAYVAAFFRDRRPVDLAAMKAFMQASYDWLEGVEPLLAALKARGVPMYALSNYSKWYELIDAKLGLSRYLDWSFVSCNTGHRKPHPEAYLCATRALNVAPERCIFVDDRASNVDAAKALGMRGILRDPRDIEKLRAALRGLDVI